MNRQNVPNHHRGNLWIWQKPVFQIPWILPQNHPYLCLCSRSVMYLYMVLVLFGLASWLLYFCIWLTLCTFLRTVSASTLATHWQPWQLTWMLLSLSAYASSPLLGFWSLNGLVMVDVLSLPTWSVDYIWQPPEGVSWDTSPRSQGV